HVIAQPLRARAKEDRDYPDRIERPNEHVRESDQVARERGEKIDRAPVFLNHTQFEPPLTRRLAAPNRLEKDEISEEDQEAGDHGPSHDPQADLPLGAEDRALSGAQPGTQTPRDDINDHG